MTDIVEEARALLAKVAQHTWSVETYGCVGGPHGCVVDPDGGTVAETWSAEDAALIAAAPRLLAALADECERLRKQNSEYHRRAQVAEAAVLEETTRGHRLGRSVGRSLANAAASTAMRECERLRAPSVQPATFGELNHPTIVKLVDEIPEHPGALGYQITDDDAHHVFVRTGAPRLGMITTLVHEMMHAAEGASGYSIPHSYVAMASFGATVALARCGVLGATDDEIDAFVEYVAGLDRSGEDRDDEVMVDPVEECERLRAENARLSEAMPSDEGMESLAVIVDVGLRHTTGTIDEHHQDPAQEAFARLDAARKVVK